jgi:hypothetical protein
LIAKSSNDLVLLITSSEKLFTINDLIFCAKFVSQLSLTKVLKSSISDLSSSDVAELNFNDAISNLSI